MRQSYSVPARYAGARVDVALGADTVTIRDRATVLATHARSLHKGSEDLVLDHYLEVLTRKPGALSGSTALVTARATKAFTPAHQAYWDAARKSLGDGAGTRALIGVLLLTRTLPADAIGAGMATATQGGNGETVQDGRTSGLIFPVASLISKLSHIITLHPGDLIFTGTPSGVGLGRTPQRFLQDGERLRTWIEGIGELNQSFVSAAGKEA